MIYSFSAESAFHLLCDWQVVPRNKTYGMLPFSVLCCIVNFNWDGTLRVLAYSSECLDQSGLMSENIWQQMTLTDCVAHLKGLVFVPCLSLLGFFSPLVLFIHNGPWPSVVLQSHQITSPFTAQGAGWLVAGLNEYNDQALCGSCSLFSLPSGEDNRGSLTLCLQIVPLWSGLFMEKNKKTKRFLLVSKTRWVQWHNKWIMGADTGFRKPSTPAPPTDL